MCCHTSTISIHALCEEGDPRSVGGVLPHVHDFYPRPLRGGRPLYGAARQGVRGISIHALCEEGDSPWAIRPARNPYFYPRPLRGGRLAADVAPIVLKKFLSTPSARRATTVGDPSGPESVFLSTPSARRATVSFAGTIDPSLGFLSTPSARRATKGQTVQQSTKQFLSTPSARRATKNQRVCAVGSQFLSTPSARRATVLLFGVQINATDFYPHPPRGGRHLSPLCIQPLHRISIHTLREEGDLQSSSSTSKICSYFYPHPPRGGRHGFNTTILHNEPFLSTPSARRATGSGAMRGGIRLYFYPHPPRGGRHKRLERHLRASKFLSTPSARRATDTPS